LGTNAIYTQLVSTGFRDTDKGRDPIYDKPVPSRQGGRYTKDKNKNKKSNEANIWP